MTAQTLLAALGTKHSTDVFVPECKNGPTQTGSHRRFDAWVLLKTWSPVSTIGYEIKVSKADWRRDEKIAEYMGLCHQLYIVAPKGIVPVEELPDGVGLIEAVGDSNRLVTRRKAPRREIEMPVSLMVYVLMCRAKIGSDQEGGLRESWKLDNLRQWAQEKDDRRQLHWALGRKIQSRFDAQEIEIGRVTARIRDLEYIEKRILEMGFDPKTTVNTWQVETRLKTMTKIIDTWLLKQMEQVEQGLSGVRKALGELRTAPATTAHDEEDVA